MVYSQQEAFGYTSVRRHFLHVVISMIHKEPKPENTILNVLRAIKNVFFGSLLVILVITLIVNLITRINGDTPVFFGYSVYRVSSDSMTPYLEVGDIILSKQCDPMTLRYGDVITYNGLTGEYAGKSITHRVIREPYQDGDSFFLITKGDDNPVEDTPVNVSQVSGKMLRKLPLMKVVYQFFLTPWGLILILLLIIVAFTPELLRLIRTKKSREHLTENR